MNNSKIALDNQEAPESHLEVNLGELSQIVEALNRVEASEEWQKLKRFLFNDIVPNLERAVAHEASKKDIDVAELHRLQGQLIWARRWVDLKKLAEYRKQQIDNIKNQLNGKNPRDGAL